MSSSAATEVPRSMPARGTARRRVVAMGLMLIGVALLALNLYGVLFCSLRHAELAGEARTRFPHDISLSFAEAQSELIQRPNESPRDFALRATRVVQQAIAHVDWESPAAARYYQQVPIWENYLLYTAGFLHEDYRRYHFTNAERLLRRGIGVCGDSACLLSTVLERAGIETRVVAFAEHVVVEAELGDGAPSLWTLDPDFGVAIEASVQELPKDPARVADAYRSAGYADEPDIATLNRIYARSSTAFESAFIFSPNHARAEGAAYVLKWLLPVMLIGAGVLLLRRK